MQRIQIINTKKNINKEVKLCGWVHFKRNLGKITFITLRDASATIQVVCPLKKIDAKAKKLIEEIGPESVIEIIGTINKRPENQINKEMKTGELEISLKDIKILSKSKTPPFEINKNRKIKEELRLKYRYLDLRRKEVKENMVLRHKIIKAIRDYLDKNEFLEIETQILAKGTPEGAREFIVPSRLYPGQFYTLPQAPQQFKQLLMIGGIEKYFQIARCFRDEGTRGNRQPEFTQLDIEISFINQEKILKLIENLVSSVIKKVLPEKKIKTPFKRMTYKEAMKKYNTDKPDIRKDKDENTLAFCFITDFPLFEKSETEDKIVSVHHPFTAPKPKSIPKLEKDPLKAKSLQYDLVCNGHEIAGGSIRIHKKELQNKIFEILNISQKEIQRKFGHLLEAFEYGAPPHGGIAFGLDRLIMLLANEPNIREVIPFPKTSDNRDLMMGAPSKLTKENLKEVHIKIDQDN